MNLSLEKVASNEDGIQFRVRLSDSFSMVGISLFGTTVICFENGALRNLNLPCFFTKWEIFDHIRADKPDSLIPDLSCVCAIAMIQDAVSADGKESDD